MVKNHYRWDFIGLSTDTKPTPDTSEKVADGSTFYESDTSKYYVWCQDDWYEKTSTGGGGGGGAVDTVNNVSPDANGNVELTPSDIGAQAALTAGSNITIDDGVISATDTTYTAGTNVTISSGNVISATDTTYSNFVGTDGTAAGVMGLVPAPATTDAGKFLKADGTWDTAGSSVNVVQTTGTSTTDVMSQVATSQLIYPSGYETSKTRIRIGNSSGSNYGIQIGKTYLSSSAVDAIAIGPGNSSGNRVESANSISIGLDASVRGNNSARSVAIGNAAEVVDVPSSVAIGYASKPTSKGEMNIGTPQNTSAGYNNSAYRLLSGVYDGQSAHDAATVGQLTPAFTNAEFNSIFNTSLTEA